MWTQLPPEKGHAHPIQFLAHVYCGQMAGWLKTPLGTEVDLGPGQSTRRDPSSCERGTTAPSIRHMSIVATVAHVSYC